MMVDVSISLSHTRFHHHIHMSTRLRLTIFDPAIPFSEFLAEFRKKSNLIAVLPPSGVPSYNNGQSDHVRG